MHQLFRVEHPDLYHPMTLNRVSFHFCELLEQTRAWRYASFTHCVGTYER